MSTLTKAVGKGGANLLPDVKQVQQQLNTHLKQLGLHQPLNVDGRIGPKTVAAIAAFQAKVLKHSHPDERVDANGATWKALSGKVGPVPGLPLKVGKPANPVNVATATINSAAETLIKQAEAKGGIADLKAYVCPAGKLTIGFGHTGSDVKQDSTITKAQAETLFRTDVSKFEKIVRQEVKVPLSSNQFSALVSFVYNVGPGNFRGHTLLTKLNAGDYQGAAAEFPKWVHGGHKVLPGLVKRRADEQKMFQTQ